MEDALTARRKRPGADRNPVPTATIKSLIPTRFHSPANVAADGPCLEYAHARGPLAKNCQQSGNPRNPGHPPRMTCAPIFLRKGGKATVLRR